MSAERFIVLLRMICWYKSLHLILAMTIKELLDLKEKRRNH